MNDGSESRSGPGGLFGAIKEMQEKVGALQERLAARTVTGEAAAGMVRAVANGRLQIVSVEIEPSLLDPDQRTMLQDLVVAAVNQALTRAQEMAGREMGQLAGSLGLGFVAGGEP